MPIFQRKFISLLWSVIAAATGASCITLCKILNSINQDMTYRKIQILYFSKYLLLGILLFICYFISNSLTELHKIELDKNLKIEEKLSTLNQLEKFELKEKYREKQEKFNDYLDYFFYTTIIGVCIILFVNRKIESENKKLDYMEENKNLA